MKHASGLCLVLIGALAAGSALAQAPARPGAAPAAAAIAKSVPPAVVDGPAMIVKANSWFNAASTMIADFVQIGPDGRRTEGTLSVVKPGRLRFEYAPPATLQIVADGQSLAVVDRKLKTQDVYQLGQTPLKFLLQRNIDLARDTKVQQVSQDDNAVTILLEDSHTFSGTSHISLVFDPKTFALKQWTVTDPQGNDTLVTLFNIDTKTAPNPMLFTVEAPKGIFGR